MTDDTIRFIMMLKRIDFTKSTLYDSVSRYLSNYTGTPKRIYAQSEKPIYDCMLDMFRDYLSSSDNPGNEFWDYIHNEQRLCVLNLYNDYGCKWRAIATTMINTQVKNSSGDYVNGFRQIVKGE